ncbi:hypothetical protein M791_11615 [Neisseria gonorrhoeae MU_NG26]|nr:hypothetical protein M725_10230 [Neisseria gonorrhoeae ATL_2011_01_08]KLS28895.1 hypothetical protein M721_06410 [Neisseria gonorrhoeae ALB_2011_03_03]KLS36457.1 hypothetical protein M735_09265 [Neisseria gonorrhoeae MIA_2011_03-09]KLS39304.1 hypothetical protein M724_08215 [Neisseria gonorrhoeae ATL_2011_01_05]KLS50249.1 hypothetical protein M772_11170 [Neisseria gonorrhoeae MU_NG3]KLS59431.1 hypothetical protein M743_11620 [Neisseria gonorrhoeae NYC_2011_05_13]KLS60676.1 hypothetical pro
MGRWQVGISQRSKLLLMAKLAFLHNNLCKIVSFHKKIIRILPIMVDQLLQMANILLTLSVWYDTNLMHLV